METKNKVRIISGLLLVGALVFLGITWWINGRDDTWLYAMCGIIVLTSIVPLFSKKSK